MKIILLESLPKILKQDILDWNKASQSEKSKMLNEIIKKYNKPELFNIRPAIKNNFYRHGINPKENPFVNFLDTLKFKPTKKQDINFMRLGDLIVSDHIDITKDYLTKESLYNRNEKDFIYTVKLFDIVNDRSKISKYFKDTTNIKESDLYSDNSMNEIKPAGKDGDGIDTLYGTVESWSGEDGKNDSKYDENEKGGYTLNQALEQLGVPKNGYNEILNIWVQKYFKQATLEYKAKYDKPITYQNILSIILSGKEKKLPQRELNDIKNRKTFNAIELIPKKENIEGNIVYLKYYHLDPEPEKDYNDIIDWIDDKNMADKFFIFNKGTWIEYDNYLHNNKKENPLIESAYNKLFNTKIITDKSNKIDIVIGILKILDMLPTNFQNLKKRYDIYTYR